MLKHHIFLGSLPCIDLANFVGQSVNVLVGQLVNTALVGGLEHLDYFPDIGNNVEYIIIPTYYHIFQRGRYTTNQCTSNASIFILWVSYE
jgi:hypothetical protein